MGGLGGLVGGGGDGGHSHSIRQAGQVSFGPKTQAQATRAQLQAHHQKLQWEPMGGDGGGTVVLLLVAQARWVGFGPKVQN